MTRVYFQGRYLDVPDPLPTDIAVDDPPPSVTAEQVLEWTCRQLNLDVMNATLEILSGQKSKV